MAQASRENKPAGGLGTGPAKESMLRRRSGGEAHPNNQRREANRRVTVMKATEYDASANNHLEVKSKNAVSSGSPLFHSFDYNTTVCTKTPY